MIPLFDMSFVTGTEVAREKLLTTQINLIKTPTLSNIAWTSRRLDIISVFATVMELWGIKLLSFLR